MPLFLARITPRCPPRGFIKTAPRLFSSWIAFPALVSDPSNQVQCYTSNSTNPFLNLSIEHYLFQKTPPGSKILFFYKNNPSVIIGRNQNPWLEVNLHLVSGFKLQDPELSALQKPVLIRRRSGGGTVFHDVGNVNWSVICDLNEFTRDKHAEMVVRALRKLGIDRARVNERHDIVLDQGTETSDVDGNDTHVTPYTSTSSENPPLKVSGSAYKLARNRALHHGTALLESPNLDSIPLFLRSPAKPFITSKGVESVSSPVGNIGLNNKRFELAVHQEFAKMYGAESTRLDIINVMTNQQGCFDIPEIRKGHDELASPDWTFLQTPQFTVSTQPVLHVESNTTTKKFSLNIKHGVVQNVDLGPEKKEQAAALTKSLENKKLNHINWRKFMDGEEWREDVAALERILPQTTAPKSS